MFFKYRKAIIVFFLLWSIISGIFITRIQFSFDFEQFFPQGDEDLEFFKSFIEEFETDDNFLLLAVENEPTVFDSVFLEKFHNYCLNVRGLPFVTTVQSLTMARAPIKTPFGISTIPIIHRNEPNKYDSDKRRILDDPRFLYNLINKKGDALVAFVKTKDTLGLKDSRILMNKVDSLNNAYNFGGIHMLGRADLQVELVKMQQEEIIKTSIISFFLVLIVLIFLFRKVAGVIVSIVSIGMSLLIFIGMLSMLGREFNIMSALYPVLILIVATSDIIHIKSKYLDELRRGKEIFEAMSITIREIGIATLLTSITTSVGFASLLTSRVLPVKEFGINSAFGVLIAYIIVIFFSTSLLTFIPKNKILRQRSESSFWDNIIARVYRFTLARPRLILVSSMLITILMVIGISFVSTNYRVENNLPRGARVTEDFAYFEKEFAGFRPFEYAVFAKGNYYADEYAVVNEVNKMEEILIAEESIRTTTSLATFYKSIERMKSGNSLKGFQFPSNERSFQSSKRILERSRITEGSVLLSRDKKKTRISSRIADLGADSVNIVAQKIEKEIMAAIDTNIISVKRTGTGLILDKNSVYIRDNLIQGLLIAIFIVSVLMGFLFGQYKMLFIALVPNILPLLLAGAIIGFLGIELEAGVSVVFAIIFGIAVDDTIHFLSKYNLTIRAGKSPEQAMKTTFQETGKALIYTTIILFFGFLIMVFSVHQPSRTVGLLIASTLVGALICDLLLLPVLMRKFLYPGISE